jgi:hypothetical protein
MIYISELGTDAASRIETFAASRGMLLGEKLHSISLGQGQGNAASEAIQQAMVSGHWVRPHMTLMAFQPALQLCLGEQLHASPNPHKARGYS